MWSSVARTTAALALGTGTKAAVRALGTGPGASSWALGTESEAAIRDRDCSYTASEDMDWICYSVSRNRNWDCSYTGSEMGLKHNTGLGNRD